MGAVRKEPSGPRLTCWAESHCQGSGDQQQLTHCQVASCCQAKALAWRLGAAYRGGGWVLQGAWVWRVCLRHVQDSWRTWYLRHFYGTHILLWCIGALGQQLSDAGGCRCGSSSRLLLLLARGRSALQGMLPACWHS